MKRCGPLLFVGFVLAVLLTLDLPDRPTRVCFGWPIGRAPCLDLYRVFDPAATVAVVKSAEFSLHLEVRRSRAGPDECLPLLSSFSLDRAPLRANDTGPPRIDPRGPPVLSSNGPAVEVARPAELTAVAPKRAINYPPNPAKTGAPARTWVLQRVIFTTGFS
jgi:hypothetical protein